MLPPSELIIGMSKYWMFSIWSNWWACSMPQLQGYMYWFVLTDSYAIYVSSIVGSLDRNQRRFLVTFIKRIKWNKVLISFFSGLYLLSNPLKLVIIDADETSVFQEIFILDHGLLARCLSNNYDNTGCEMCIRDRYSFIDDTWWSENGSVKEGQLSVVLLQETEQLLSI